MRRESHGQGGIRYSFRQCPGRSPPTWHVGKELVRRGREARHSRASWRGRLAEVAHRPPIAVAPRWDFPAASPAGRRSHAHVGDMDPQAACRVAAAVSGDPPDTPYILVA